MAVMGRRTAVWKAALWGAVAGSLPDLDVFIDHGDAIRNMTFHRGATHGLFWLTALSPVLAWLVSRVHGQREHFRRWWLALWLALVTHPLLDAMTAYGTQLLQPFSDYPFAVGSVYIIDPLYTVPLLVGMAVALSRREFVGLRWCRWGLALSTAYLGWSLAAQWYVRDRAYDSLAARGIQAERVLVTPTYFNTVLWRVVAMTDGGYEEGFYSMLDRGRPIHFDRFASDHALYEKLKDRWPVQRIAWYSHGFFKMYEQDGQIDIADLRMGLEPAYTFAFHVAQNDSGFSPVTPQNVGTRGDVGKQLAWLGPRMLGRDVAPPR